MSDDYQEAIREPMRQLADKGGDLREDVRRLVTDALLDKHLDPKALREIMKATVEGLGEGLSGHAETAAGSLKTAMSGLDEALGKGLYALQLALDESWQRGKRFTDEDLRVAYEAEVGIGSWVEQSDIDWIISAFKKYLPGHGNNITCYSKENPEGQKVILQNSGFEDIQVYVETRNFVLPGAEIWWQQMRQAASEYFKQVSDLDILVSFKEQVLIDLEQFHYPEGIRFSKTVSFAFGSKPV